MGNEVKDYLNDYCDFVTKVTSDPSLDLEALKKSFIEIEEKYGRIEEMNVLDNLAEHLVGNVYVKFRREEDAEKAVKALNNRWFGGRPIYAELSPVTDFWEACCRQYETGECPRSGFCNFMHLKPISRNLKKELFRNYLRS